MSEGEVVSVWNWNVIRDGEAGRWGARWKRSHFQFGLSAVKPLIQVNGPEKSYSFIIYPFGYS